MKHSRRSPYLPERQRTADHVACAPRALTGIIVRGATLASDLRKRPSRDMAYRTREPDRMRPFRHPNVETRITTAMMSAGVPDSALPVTAPIAAVATRSSGAEAIPEIGRAFR